MLVHTLQCYFLRVNPYISNGAGSLHVHSSRKITPTSLRKKKNFTNTEKASEHSKKKNLPFGYVQKMAGSSDKEDTNYLEKEEKLNRETKI